MAYNKTIWKNDTTPDIDATNLNKMENGIFNNDANITNLKNALSASDFSNATIYKAGDIVWESNRLYECKINMTAPENWVAGHWRYLRVADRELEDRRKVINDYDNTKSYSIGAYVFYDLKIFRCKAQTTAGEGWVSGHWVQVTLDVMNELHQKDEAIKSDVSDLQEDVIEINEEIENTNKNLVIGDGGFYSGQFIRGDVSSEGTVISRDYRVVSLNTIIFNNDIYIQAKNGFTGALWIYPEGESAYSKPMDGVIISANTVFRIVIRRIVENTSEVADINEFVSAISWSKINYDATIKRVNSYNIDDSMYKEFEYIDLLKEQPALNNRTGVYIGFDEEIRYKENPYSIKFITTAGSSNSGFRFTVGSAMKLLGVQEIDVYVYIEDKTKVTSIRLSAINASLVKTITTFENGWNKLRFFTEGAGNWDETVDNSVWEILVYTTYEITIWLGKCLVVKPPCGNVIVIDDGPYASFYNQAYPLLLSHNIPVTWAIDPAFIGESENIITNENLETLSSDGISEFSFHSYDGTIMSNATAVQALKDTVKSIRYLRKKGIEPNKIWRAAWLQNSCAHPELANQELEASACNDGSAAVTAYPFVDKYNIPRMSMQDRSQSWFDTLFLKLKKEHCTVLVYTHGISSASTDMSLEMLEYFIDKMDEGISDGYINATTFNRLVQRFEKIN